MEPKLRTDELLWGALRPLLARLVALAQEDAVVRAELQELGNTLLTLTTVVTTETTPPVAQIVTAPPATILTESVLADSVPVDSVPVDSLSADSVSADSIPVDSVTVDSVTVDSVTVDSVTVDSVPAETAQQEGVPADNAPRADTRIPESTGPELEIVPPSPVNTQPATAQVETAQSDQPLTSASGETLDGQDDDSAHQRPASNALPQAARPASPLGVRAPAHPTNQVRAVYLTSIDGSTEQRLHATRIDLETIATSCALKADASRWLRERQRLAAQGKNLPPEVAAQKWKLIEHAQTLPECYLWMLHQELPPTTDPALYEDLGGCYEACALIAGLLDKLVANEQQTQPFLIQALSTAAVAQAALRNAIQAIGGTADGDQRKLYRWVEEAHAQYHLQMRRYTRRSKEANPHRSADLVQQVQELFNKISAQRKRQNTQRRLLRISRTLAQNIQAHPDDVTAQEWQEFIEAVVALVTAGIPPSSVELRNLLLPLVDLLPETIEQPKSFALVLREVDRFLDQEPEEGTAIAGAASSAEVLRVRTLLQGESVVFIGGERRLAAEEALRSAFALKELIWIAGHDQAYTTFEPYVARADVSVVILALRWSRHGFGQVKEYCDHYDKLFVRLLRGYNPNQVAHVILNQIGERLEQRMPKQEG